MTKLGWMISEAELDSFQRQVLNLNPNSRSLIQGCAGSGKSVLALHLAKHILAAQNTSVLVIVFTNTLSKYMKDGIRELALPENICMLAHNWANANPRPSADYIIVDEVQDFKQNEPDTWPGNYGKLFKRATIEAFHESARLGLIMFGDDAQMLYSRGTDLIHIVSMLNIKGGFYQNLQMNYRLPKKIARVAERIMDPVECIEGRCTREGENVPFIKKCNNREEEMVYIMNKIMDNDLENVGVLVPDNKDVEYVYTFLNHSGISAEAKTSKIDTLDFSSTNPKIVTYHSSKGLQFENVFIPFCVEKKNDRKPLYVAMTRTLDRLYITYSSEECSFFDDLPANLLNRI